MNFSILSLIAILVCSVSTSAFAQRIEMAPHEFHAVNPSLSVTTPTSSPLLQQMRQDYATSLMGAQRDLLQQNPSGLGRQEQAIGRELNGYMAPR